MSEPQPTARPLKTESWENEGGTTAPSPEALAESLGVVRHVTETYSVGEFRYTSLTDAIAQTRRMTKLEQALL